MKPAIHRLVSVFLTFVCIISTLMTCTFSWQSINQQAQNDKIGKAAAYPVELLKLEKLPDGTLTENPVQGAAFYLYTIDGVQIGGRFESDADGKIAVQIPAGDYYFEEIDPAPDYAFDEEGGQPKKNYPFTVEGKGSTQVTTVRAYNIPVGGSLLIHKLVENADGSPLTAAQKELEFTFLVTFSDGGTYEYRIGGGAPQTITGTGTIVLKHDETAVFSEIPVGVLYNVTEQPVTEYITTSTGHQGNITEAGCVAEFVNTYTPDEPEKLGKLTVKKQLSGAAGADRDKLFHFTVTLDGVEQNFDLKHGESKTFEDLPIGTQYTVTEDDYSAEQYISGMKTYTGQITGEEEQLVMFANYYDPDPDPDRFGSLEVTKKVIGDLTDPEKEFTFSFVFSDGGTYEYSVDGGAAETLASGGTVSIKAGQTILFQDIAAGVGYTVTEQEAAGFLADIRKVEGSIAGDEKIAVTFTNRQGEIPDAPDDKGKLTVTKKLAGEYTDTDLEKEFTFTLSVDGVESFFILKADESITFELPVGSRYEVREEDYFAQGFSQSVTGGSGTIVIGLREAVVTNTFVGKVQVDITGEKTWDLLGYPENVKPASITVVLMDGDHTVEEKEVIPDENGEWHYTFTAPKYANDGTEIQYTVIEKPLYNFLPSYEGTYNIKNTYLPPVSIDPPILKKVVRGDAGAPLTTFEFLLTGGPGHPMPEGSAGNTKILTLDGSGQLEIGRITFDRTGVYTYTLKELGGGEQGWTYDTALYTLTATVTQDAGRLVAAYVLTKDGAAADEIVFVNDFKRVETPDKTIVSGAKTWNHGSNTAQPSAIVVEVYGDGILVAKRQVTAQNNWAYSFELPKYAADGHVIVYTVDEEAVPGYDKRIDGYNLINTYREEQPPEPEKPDKTEKPEMPDKANAPEKPEDPGILGGLFAPKTGDEIAVWLAVSCLILGIDLLCIALVLRKKRKNNEEES